LALMFFAPFHRDKKSDEQPNYSANTNKNHNPDCAGRPFKCGFCFQGSASKVPVTWVPSPRIKQDSYEANKHELPTTAPWHSLYRLLRPCCSKDFGEKKMCRQINSEREQQH
jgi:hypothetical protein